MLKKHYSHIHQVLQHLQEVGLQANIDKYKFYTQETKFFGLIIFSKIFE